MNEKMNKDFKALTEDKQKIKELEWELQEVAKDNDYYQAENKRLEQENADLKKKLNMFASLSTDSCFAHHEKAKMLEQAKEIIDNLLSDNRIMKAQFESEEQAQVWFKHIEQAEQFLKEMEK